MRRLTVCSAILLTGCPSEPAGTDDVPVGWVADPRADVVDCPNAPGCEPTEDRVLRVGAAVRSVVPSCYEDWTDVNGDWSYRAGAGDTFRDCGCDRLCPEDEGYPGADEGEGDSIFRASWLAGFQNARAAVGVRGADQGWLGEGDGLEARAIVFDQGNTRVALVAIDSIGVMYDDALGIRTAVQAADLDVDHVIVHSTHSHSAPDMMGIYGRQLTESGRDPEYAAEIIDAGLAAVTEAVGGLQEVTMSFGEINANDVWEKGVANVIRDSRDPWIVDPRVGVLRFAAGETTVATVVHFANHPETIADDNGLMTSDFVHGIRRTVSEGSTWKQAEGKPGVGGTTIYINGTVGGMMTSLGASVDTPDGETYQSASWDKVDAVGTLLGELALDALAAAQPAVDPELRVLARSLKLPVENFGFQAMFSLGVFAHRSVVDYDPTAPISADNQPFVPTEIDLLQLGPVRILTMPGEVFPECVIGGYDGAWLPEGQALVREGNPNPPKLELAPEGPYFLDTVGGELNWIVSLGNDELGYVIPPYNFETGEPAYLNEAEGDHYEETNSLGPTTWPLMEASAKGLLEYAYPAAAE